MANRLEAYKAPSEPTKIDFDITVTIQNGLLSCKDEWFDGADATWLFKEGEQWQIKGTRYTEGEGYRIYEANRLYPVVEKPRRCEMKIPELKR